MYEVAYTDSDLLRTTVDASVPIDFRCDRVACDYPAATRSYMHVTYVVWHASLGRENSVFMVSLEAAQLCWSFIGTSTMIMTV